MTETDDSFLPTEAEMEQLSRRAHAIYDERLKALLEPAHLGEFVAIHPDSGDYEVAKMSSKAHFALRDRQPEGKIVTTKIGPADDDPWVYRILASQLLAGRNK